MKTVLFLGAGATRAQYLYELRTREDLLRLARARKKTVVRPPCGCDFLKLAAVRCRNDFPVVRSYFMYRYHVDLLQDSGIDVQEVFTKLAKEATATKSKDFVKAAWHHLLVCYRKLIGCSTNPLSLPAGSPLPSLLGVLVNDRIRLTTVTANQDLLVERIIARRVGVGQERKAAMAIPTSEVLRMPIAFAPVIRRQSIVHYYAFDELLESENNFGVCEPTTWELSVVYGLRFDHSGTVTNELSDRPRELPPDNWPQIPVLKLHGSLNWWYASHSHLDPAPTRRDVPLCLLKNEDVAVPMGVEVLSDLKPYFYPLVVPFVADKRAFLRLALQPVWEKAKVALAECDHLVVFGYGFPMADKEARELFSKSLGSRVKEIHVIDKYDTAARRLIHLRDHVDPCAHDGEKVKYHECVDDYLAGKETPLCDRTCPECEKKL